MQIELTKESDYLICILYKSYLQKRKNGTSKFNAKIFGSSEDIRDTLLPKWSYEDVDETCCELSRANLLTCSYADDIVSLAVLNDNAIIYMENRFANKIDNVLKYMEKIKSAIPFF